ISAPMNEVELRNLMYTAQLEAKGPFVIRYPRGNGVLTDWQKPFTKIPIGKGRQLKEGRHAAIISIGPVGNSALEVAYELEKSKGISLSLFDLRFLKPVDEDLLHHVFRNFKTVFTIEDNARSGGMGSMVLE